MVKRKKVCVGAASMIMLGSVALCPVGAWAADGTITDCIRNAKTSCLIEKNTRTVKAPATEQNSDTMNVMAVSSRGIGLDLTNGRFVEANEGILTGIAQSTVELLNSKTSELSGGGGKLFNSDEGLSVWVDELDWTAVALGAGDDIVAALEMVEGDLSGYDEEDLADLQEIIGEGWTPYRVAEAWVGLYDNDADDEDNYLGEVMNLTTPVTMTHDVSGASAVADGMARSWKVVNVHWDFDSDDWTFATIEAGYDAETNTIAYENDRFSYIIIAYQDVEAEEAEEEETATEVASPNTGSMTAQGSSVRSAAVMTAISVGVISAIVGFAYLIRRRS